jgi:hypothetical protein
VGGHLQSNQHLRVVLESVALRPVWWSGCAILLGLMVAISVEFWREVGTAAERTVAQQINYEDGLLCAKFGFPAGTAGYLSCKLDLLDLRLSHERLLAATSVP